MSRTLPQHLVESAQRAPRPLSSAQLTVERALSRFSTRAQIEPLAVRHVFAAAFRAALVGSFGDAGPPAGPVLLGLMSGPRLAVPIGGLDVRVSLAEPSMLAPTSVTPFSRGPDGLVVGADAAFGTPDRLVAAARVIGLPPELGVDALRAVLRELCRPMSPTGVLTARYVDDGVGWQGFRLVEVVEQVQDPGTQIPLATARTLDRDCRPGDLLGLGVPVRDWLTPLLCWMAGGG